MSCGLQNAPSSARKSDEAFELLRPWASCWTRAGEANIWVANGRVWGFLSSLLDQHVPEVPSCEGSAQPMRRRWADTAAAGPRRLQRKPLAEDGKCHSGPHNPSCCNPQSWRHRGLSEKCVVQGLNSYLCVCHRSRAGEWLGLQRPIKTTQNVSFAFLLFCCRPLGCPRQLGVGAQREHGVMGQC